MLGRLLRRSVEPLGASIERDAILYRVGDFVVAVTGRQAVERRPWQTPAQIAWQNALDMRNVRAQRT